MRPNTIFVSTVVIEKQNTGANIILTTIPLSGGVFRTLTAASKTSKNCTYTRTEYRNPEHICIGQ